VVLDPSEACNFQDLTGQRISKVDGDDEIHRTPYHTVMMDIWGGIDAIKAHAPGAGRRSRRRWPPPADNGPKLAGDAGHASQDDIPTRCSTDASCPGRGAAFFMPLRKGYVRAALRPGRGRP